MESKKLQIFKELIANETERLSRTIPSYYEKSHDLLEERKYDMYLRNAEKIVDTCKSIDYLEDLKREVIGLVALSESRPSQKSPSIDKGYVNNEANYMEGLIKAVTDLAEEKPPEEPKKKVDGGNSELKKAFERYGDRPLNPIAGLDIGEDGVISDSNW